MAQPSTIDSITASVVQGALENIAIIRERNLVGNASEVGAHMQALLKPFASHPLVG